MSSKLSLHEIENRISEIELKYSDKPGYFSEYEIRCHNVFSPEDKKFWLRYMTLYNKRERERGINKIHFKVEWLEGYGKQKPLIITLDEIINSELKNDMTWNMQEYIGSDWIDQMVKIKINNHLDVYDNLEHIRFTRIEEE